MKRYLSIVFLLLSFSFKMTASHLAGLSLTVRYSGNADDYFVKVIFYRDCAGILASSILKVWYEKDGIYQGFITLPSVSTTLHTNTLCTFGFPINCANGMGTEKIIYETIISLPSNGVYKFYTSEFLNNSITTIPANNPDYVEALVDFQQAPHNTLPEFTSNPEILFLVTYTFNFPSYAIDPDGDSIVYSFAPAYYFDSTTMSPASMIYYTGNDSSTFNIFIPPANLTSNGAITFTPPYSAVGYTNIKADEFRNGIWIGSTMRMTVINVTNNCNCITGLNEYDHSIPITVSPNPANDKLYIDSKANIAHYTITDIVGHHIIAGAFKESINLEALNPGIYLVYLQTSSGKRIVKFIKE